LFTDEDRLFVEKSRTMMATWWGVGECFHYVMTHQPAGCIFWCPDEDRAIKCISYCKVLYSRMTPEFKKVYPLTKGVDLQPVYSFHFAGGGQLMALPGKNPDKIRSEHPAIVMMDEIAFNEHGAEAYANAIATRPKKLLAVSSANAGWFFEFIEKAEPEPLEESLQGVSLRRMAAGQPGAGIPVARIHYTADPNMTPAVVAELKSAYPDEST